MDYAIVAVVAISATWSLFRGFVREAISLLGWIVALWVALSYLDNAVSFVDLLLGAALDDAKTPTGVALGLLLLVVLLLAGVVNFAVGKYIHRIGLTGADRVLGTIFGAIRGGVLVVVLVLFAGLTTVPQSSWWKTSTLVPYAQQLAVQIRSILPKELAVGFVYP